MADKVIPRYVADKVPMSRELARLLNDVLNGKGTDSIGTLLSGINQNSTDIADIEGDLSGSYGIFISGSDGTIESLEGAGPPGGAVNISASVINLAAPAINFGSDTTFEDTYNTIYSESGAGTRVRILGPFPASGDLVLWWGLDSVALNSETKTNAILALSEGDSDVYKDGVPLGNTSGFTVAISPSSVSGSGAGSATTGSVAVTPSGGSTPYSYLWTCQNSSGIVTNAAPDTPTADTTTVSSSSSESGVVRCIVSDDDGIVRVVTATYSLTVT